jgi:hypothetical protein
MLRRWWSSSLKQVGVISGATGSWVIGAAAIASGIVNLSEAGAYTISAESGSSDSITQITGLPEGHTAILIPASGEAITVVNGPNLKLQGVDFVMNDQHDMMEIYSAGSDVCRERSRASNG